MTTYKAHVKQPRTPSYCKSPTNTIRAQWSRLLREDTRKKLLQVYPQIGCYTRAQRLVSVSVAAATKAQRPPPLSPTRPRALRSRARWRLRTCRRLRADLRRHTEAAARREVKLSSRRGRRRRSWRVTARRPRSARLASVRRRRWPPGDTWHWLRGQAAALRRPSSSCEEAHENVTVSHLSNTA